MVLPAITIKRAKIPLGGVKRIIGSRLDPSERGCRGICRFLFRRGAAYAISSGQFTAKVMPEFIYMVGISKI